MRILILGHRGMLGSELLLRLSVAHAVTGKDLDECDIASEHDCRRAIAETQPDVVINAAAYTDVDGAEKERERCFSVNADGIRNIALACRPGGIRIVHFSTDYVFDGAKGAPYREDDPCFPLNVYGEAKLAGERYLRQYSDHHLLIRTAWLYGRQGKNFVKTVLAKAGETGRLEIVDDQRGSPTYVKDLAAGVDRLLAGGHTGLFHLVNRGSCSWYEFALKILAFAGLHGVTVLPVGSGRISRPAVRPRNAALDSSRFVAATGKTMRFWQVALSDFISRERLAAGGG